MNNSNNTHYQMASCTSTRNHSQVINSAFTLLFLLVVALLPARFAQAAMITFSDFSHLGSDSVDYIVTIADDAEAGVTANHFKISYQVVSLRRSPLPKNLPASFLMLTMRIRALT